MTDPTEDYIQMKSGFSSSQTQRYNDNVIFNSSYQNRSSIKLELDLKKSGIKEAFPNVFVDSKKLNELIQIKDQNFKRQGFLEARNQTNPFENIGKSIFFDRAAVKLANIDSIFNLTSFEYIDDEDQRRELSASFGGQLAPQLMDEFYYCDIAGAPGGWTEYIQYRRPGSIGIGISLSNSDVVWNESIINMDKFTINSGENGTGNLYSESDSFIKFALASRLDYYDLIMCDGGFNVESNEELQETLSTRLILCEFYVGASLVKDNRHFVCKIFDSNTKFMADLFYLMSILFESIYIFKPISSRPANAERYFIGRNLIPEKRSEVVNILNKLYRGYSDTEYYSSILKFIPQDYVDWLNKHNELNLNRQIEYTHRIINHLNGIQIKKVQYNLYKALILWNIPDNIDRTILRPLKPKKINQRAYIPRTSKNQFTEINIEGMMKVSVGSKKRVTKKNCPRV
jgi:cap1 methyltransferase